MWIIMLSCITRTLKEQDRLKSSEMQWMTAAALFFFFLSSFINQAVSVIHCHKYHYTGMAYPDQVRQALWPVHPRTSYETCRGNDSCYLSLTEMKQDTEQPIRIAASCTVTGHLCPFSSCSTVSNGCGLITRSPSYTSVFCCCTQSYCNSLHQIYDIYVKKAISGWHPMAQLLRQPVSNRSQSPIISSSEGQKRLAADDSQMGHIKETSDACGDEREQGEMGEQDEQGLQVEGLQAVLLPIILSLCFITFLIIALIILWWFRFTPV